MDPKPDLNAVMAECKSFPQRFESLHLATCNAAGEPEASYAPYVEVDGNYYIYTSELSAHTANLAQSGRCSVLFIESEAEAKLLFARQRLTVQCRVSECPRDSAEFESLMDRFVEKFGNFMSMMRNLNDFHLYRLSPQTGSYVVGFARAYALSGEGLSEIRHRTDEGHRSADKAANVALDNALT